MLRSVKWAVVSIVAGTLPLAGQDLQQGIPFTVNYSKSEYKGGTQSWDIVQGEDGLIYIANNDGLLEFDGHEWRTTPVSNRTILRSVALGRDGRIYAGAQGELGYYAPDGRGVLQYHSLKSLALPGQAGLEDVWDIVPFKDAVYFRAADVIIRYEADTAGFLYPSGQFNFMGAANGRLFAGDSGSGLVEISGTGQQPLAGRPAELGPLTAALPFHPDTILFTTLRGGIFALSGGRFFRWRTPADDFLARNRIYTATLLPQGRLALGTSQGGVIILSRYGQPLYYLNKGKGLQNNNILSLFADRQGNLWVGADNGIDYVMANSPFSFIIPDEGLEGTGYAALIRDGRAYFGTASGLYYANWGSRQPLASQSFRLVDHTQGQTWGLAEVGGQILLGHHEGGFLVTGNTARPLADYDGAWAFAPLPAHSGYMIGGAYDGLYLFRKAGQGWELAHHYEELDESCRILALQDSNIIWVAHPYRGIYRVQLKEGLYRAEVAYFTEADGLPSNNFNHVFKVNNEVVFTTERGVYRFDDQAGRFEPHPAYTEYFGANAQVKRLVEGPDGNVWFVTAEEVGVLEIEDAGLSRKIRKRLLPRLQGKLVGGFELIYPYDGRHVIFGADKGFIIYSHGSAGHDSLSARVLLRKVEMIAGPDSLLKVERQFHPMPEAGVLPVFQHRENAFRFSFALPVFGDNEFVQYSYQLEGLEPEWSQWAEKAEKEYTNLSPGRYAFWVKALMKDGQESRPVSYTFEILPPWYASRAAYLIYGALAFLLLLSLVVVPQRRFSRERAILQDEHRKKEEAHRRREAAAQEELVRLKNEKLQSEITHKNQELASATLHLLQKSDLLTKTGEQLHRIAKNSREESTRKEIQALINALKRDAQMDEDWEQFSLHFDHVHSDFLKHLREKYPNLTPKDQKLCAYLRMNLSSKEMAALMNISVRGVEISRYRLRKKLGLDTEENLTEFMMGL